MAKFLATLREVQTSVRFPPGYDPKNLSHVPTAKWLRKHKIYDFHAKDPYVMTALDILDRAEVRRATEIMLLGPLNFASIAYKLREVFDVDPKAVTAQTIKYFAHYFWNTSEVQSPAMVELLRAIPGVSEDYYFAYQCPRSQVGATMSVYVATKGGSGVPSEPEMFRFMRDNAFMEFIRVSATRSAGLGKATAMQQLANTITSMQEQLDMRRGGGADFVDHMRTLHTVYDNNRLTTVQDLPIHVLTSGETVDEPKQ